MIVSVKTPTAEYNVIIGPDAVSQVGSFIPESSKTLVITDDCVKQICSISLKGKKYIHTLRQGEDSKSFSSYLSILRKLSKYGFTRTDYIVALGGGVVCDIAGFAASSYMRGIKLVMCPTTLLAQVDASVGGKNGINTVAGKNTIGTFYQPDAVFCDTSVLSTLSSREYANGMAEIIKTAAISDTGMFEKVYSRKYGTEELIADCVRFKSHIVGADEHDRGIRHILNFGHTLGHAIEKFTDYSVSHGRAVSMGMASMARACSKNGYCSEETSKKLLHALGRHGLPTRAEIDFDCLKNYIMHDKKYENGLINLIVLKEIGRCEVVPFECKQAIAFLESGF